MNLNDILAEIQSQTGFLRILEIRRYQIEADWEIHYSVYYRTSDTVRVEAVMVYVTGLGEEDEVASYKNNPPLFFGQAPDPFVVALQSRIAEVLSTVPAYKRLVPIEVYEAEAFAIVAAYKTQTDQSVKKELLFVWDDNGTIKNALYSG